MDASDVWVSVEPIIPNLNGLTPSDCSYFRPRASAALAYSRGSMSRALGSGPKLPLSQVP